MRQSYLPSVAVAITAAALQATGVVICAVTVADAFDLSAPTLHLQQFSAAASDMPSVRALDKWTLRTRPTALRAANDDEAATRQGTEQETAAAEKEDIKPDILDPFLPAIDPMYMCRGVVGDGDFVLERTGEPRSEELSNENLLRILKIECSDLEVNTLVWKCLGYRFNAEKEEWTSDACFPKWKDKYPQPPDLIGMRRVYSKEIDQPSLRSNQSLVRSIPADNKQSLKTHLKPLGFSGYKYAELTPNKTRRAQCANWLLYYREELFGFTVEELKERRRLKLEKEEQERIAKLKATGEDTNDEWKPPVREVF